MRPNRVATATATRDKASLPAYARRAAAAKKAVKQGLFIPRLLTSRLRFMPDFIIIGGQKCGTSSLYNYLIQHPCVAPAFRKEVHFFDLHFTQGIAWYRAHFPTLLYRRYVRQVHGRPLVAGESSPYYIFHPLAAERVADTVPHARLIALLRNPVDRAYSHHQKQVRNGLEPLSFEVAIRQEEERLGGETERLVADTGAYSFSHQKHSYLARGLYADQLAVWMSHFPPEQILILRSEDLFEEPAIVFDRVIAFLGLPHRELARYRRYNYASYSHMDGAIRQHLMGYFRPHNQRLYEMLGADLGWDG